MNDVRLTVRIDFGSERALGPGKIRLLEAVGRTGSISQAGRSLDMSYRRAWLLVDDMNQCFREPVVTTQSGGAQGGGAELTPFGQDLIATYPGDRVAGARGGEAAAARARARAAPASAQGATGGEDLTARSHCQALVPMRRTFNSSCPALCRASTSFFSQSKAWMAGT